MFCKEVSILPSLRLAAGVRVQQCTGTWWMETLRRSRFQQRREKGGIYAETMELHDALGAQMLKTGWQMVLVFGSGQPKMKSS